MTTIAEALGKALECHRSGNFPEAERLYRLIIEADPCHVDALQLYGTVAFQTERIELAVKCLREALKHKPDYAEVHSNLGYILTQQGQLEEAIYHCRQAIQYKPGHAEAHNNLGNALQMLRKSAEAAASCREAIRIKPGFAEAHNNLGNALKALGEHSEAADSYREAIRLSPGFAEAHNNLAILLRELGKSEEAVICAQEAIRLNPRFVKAYNNLAIALLAMGRPKEAAGRCQDAIRLKPDYAEAHNTLGGARAEQGMLEEAISSFQEVLRLRPDVADAHNNLGIIMARQGKLDEAEAYYRQAVRLEPDHALAYNNLGNVLHEQGRLDEAIAAHRKAIELKHDASNFHSNLVFILPFHPRHDAETICKENRLWNRQHAEAFRGFICPHANHPDPERRLRIGYVSPDFKEHCQALFTIPLLSNHDHRRYEIHCYSGVVLADAITHRIRGYADVWRSTVGLADEQVADMVRRDQIDILVDLTMHMANNRLLVFARKPAPVQVCWLAYPGTTGLSTMDYRLTDPYLDPPELSAAWYSEESIRLLDTFWCYDPTIEQPLVNELPARHNGFVTFGCLNNFAKINDGTLMLWAKVLRAVPEARLLLLAPRGQARKRVLAKLEAEGIAGTRVEFVDKQPRPEYLRVYHRIDAGLDLLPSNGHTTSLDAFWMGVPTVTLVGKTVVGRAGWSQLCNLGMKELAAWTPEEYVTIVTKLVGDLPRMEELRATLRSRMRQSPLMDGNRFARNMEQAYRQMWRRWCQTNALRSQPAEGRVP